MFPQERKTAVLDVPEADLAGPMIRKISNCARGSGCEKPGFAPAARLSPGGRVSSWLFCCGRWLAKPLLRQIRHAGVLGTVFPQERKTAVLDVPEADLLGLDGSNTSSLHVWIGRVPSRSVLGWLGKVKVFKGVRDVMPGQIVRTFGYPATPMSVGDALSEMELVRRDFRLLGS
nr:sigma 54 modulation/S30EA ribosomal C-terminal domain-containing protein [Corynebacterium canis]